MKINFHLKKKTVSRAAAAALAAVMLLTWAVSCGLSSFTDAESRSAQEEICVDGERLRTLHAFLSRFVGRYPVTPEGKWEYDSHAVNNSSKGSNILACIVTPASCADWSLYTDIPAEDCFVEKTDDPRGWSKDTYAYYVYDGETVEFIAREIFNVSESGIRRLTESGENAGLFYYENGRYYTLFEGVLENYSDIEILSVRQPESASAVAAEENRYIVTFKVNGVVNKTENDDDELTMIRGVRSAELALKTIGGREYWSLYRFY